MSEHNPKHSAFQERLPSSLKLIDLNGLKPGDPYSSANFAAIAALDEYFVRSRNQNQEVAGMIYQRKDGKYSYTEGNWGDEKSSDAGGCPSNVTPVAMYHTHAGYDVRYKNEQFSKTDKSTADQLGLDSYLKTPGYKVKGKGWVLSPKFLKYKYRKNP